MDNERTKCFSGYHQHRSHFWYIGIIWINFNEMFSKRFARSLPRLSALVQLTAKRKKSEIIIQNFFITDKYITMADEKLIKTIMDAATVTGWSPASAGLEKKAVN